MFAWLFDLSSWFFSFFAAKQAKLVVVGLANAGKSTLIQLLARDRVMALQPTFYPNEEEFQHEGIQFNAYDLGGHPGARPTWKNYFCFADAIIFVVDASRPEYFQESKAELDNILSDPTIANIPVMVLGNKIDSRTAVSEEVLRISFSLPSSLTTGKTRYKRECQQDGRRPLEVFMVSVTLRAGLKDAFSWLVKVV